MKQKHLIHCAVVVLCSLVLLTACASAEKNSEWKKLFDGKTTAGWRGLGQKDFPKHGWVIEDNCLHLLPDIGDAGIVTVEQYSDFEFEWDWRIAPKANNGIKYFVIEEGEGKKSPGHEYQMIDDTTHASTDSEKHKTASFYDVLAPTVKPPVKKPGEWNHSRLVVFANHVEHWLNGKKVLAYELGSPEVMAAVAKSKFKEVPGFGEKTKGHILLTDHHGETWYRNLRLRKLPEK